jgi:hypothetical protein
MLKDTFGWGGRWRRSGSGLPCSCKSGGRAASDGGKVVIRSVITPRFALGHVCKVFTEHVFGKQRKAAV